MELILKFHAVNASIPDEEQYCYSRLRPNTEYFIDRIQRQDTFVILELTSTLTACKNEYLLPKQYARVVLDEDIYEINEKGVQLCLIFKIKPSRRELTLLLYDMLIRQPGSK
jgi:hypothetical protein